MADGSDPTSGNVSDCASAGVVRPDNEPSLAVCRRLRMLDQGLTSRYYGSELELFSMGSADWEAADGTP